MKKFVVFTEIFNDRGCIERWYYGTYNLEEANRVALGLGNEYPIFHCVVPEDEAKEWDIQNLPF